ncbi:MAG: asparagine synthase (glutamine-hydrolyzing), partial [Planctomycetota bacterium]
DSGEGADDARRLEQMLDGLAHRGPDGRGIARGERASMGCTRLAIRGKEGGAQPLRTRRGHLVFNGEIYNLSELAKDIRCSGMEVDASSDTAVVGALLDRYGIRAVDRLNGMFALAWDDGEWVHLARDPAGIKPLYYRPQDGAFASEIHPLLAGRNAELCGTALARWLTFHAAHGTETLFQGILRVPQGGIVTLPGGRVVRKRSPALRFSTPNPAIDAGRLRKVLERSLRDALPRERFGLSLSGGVDSSLVASLAREGDAVAFHGRVDAKGCDESQWARAAARELGLELIEVEVSDRACLEAFPDVVRALEEPVAGPGGMAQWLVAQCAAKEVRIVLGGCGGDELFGGYARAAALCHDTPPAGLENYAPLFDRVRGMEPARRAFTALDRREPSLLHPEFAAAHPEPFDEFREAFEEGALDPVSAAARAEMAIILPALLQVEDRTTMAFGVEGRVPLLDRRLLRAAARLGPRARVNEQGRLKALFREAADPLLPAAVRGRTDKMGFPLPLGEWFGGVWGDFAREVLSDRRTRERGMVHPAGVERALRGSGRYDRGLYSLLWLELWCREFCDQPLSSR